MWLDPETLVLSDGASVTAWTDSSGNSNNATIPSGDEPIYRDGSNNYQGVPEVAFEDDAYRISVPQPTSLSAGGSWTLAFRFRPTLVYRSSTSNFFILNEESAGTVQSFSLAWGPEISENRYRLGARDSAGTFSSNTLTESAIYPSQHLIMITYDGTGYKLYIDDWITPVGTLTVTSEMTGAGALYLSNHPTVDASAGRGAWGDVLIYDNALGTDSREFLQEWFEGKWPPRTKRLGDYTSGTHNIPSNHSGDLFQSPFIQVNPDGTHYDMVAARVNNGSRTGELHWFHASASDPHNWTHMNGGVAILDVGASFHVRGSSFVWFGGRLILYYENRNGGGIYYATGSDFDGLTDQGRLLPNPGGSVYYRFPMAWVRDSKVYMIIDERQGSATSAFGHLLATNSADGETSWATPNTIFEDSAVEDGIADDVGAPSVIVLDESTGETIVMFAGFNDDYRTGHPGITHSIWYATFTSDPMTGAASLVKDGAVASGLIGGCDAYAHNVWRFYDRRTTDGQVDIYGDGQDADLNVGVVVFNEQVLSTSFAT